MIVDICFPVRARRHETSFPDEIAYRYGTSIEDERRLFYVASTRSRERLFLLDSSLSQPNKRSIFLTEQQTLENTCITSILGIDSKVWKICSEDLKETDPPPLRIGLSDLLLYLECPYQYGLRRTTAIQPSVGEELGYGLGLHELINRRLDDGVEWQSDTLNHQIEKYVNLPYMSEQGENNSRKAIGKHMSKLEKLGMFLMDVKSEINIELVLNNGIIHGIIDCVQINSDKTLSIKDWKTNIHDHLLHRYERQIQFYTYALRNQGDTVSTAEIIDISKSAKQNDISRHIVDISEETVSKLIYTLGEALNGITAGSYLPNPNSISCSCCDINKICAVRVSK